MRAAEQRWLNDKELAEKRDAAAESETHRLRYVYFLNRLTEALSMPAEDQAMLTEEIRECARLCRMERAEYVGLTEAEADRQHGTVLSVALGRVRRMVN